MTDIVQKLRRVDPNQALLAAPPHDTSYLQVGLICHEAAAEIERLRAALQDIARQPEGDEESAQSVAKAVLRHKP